MVFIKENVVDTVVTKEENIVSTVESDIEKIYEESVDGVVFIESQSRYAEGTGSGFIYKIENGEAYILTNYHVIDGASQINITTNSGEVVEGIEYLGGDELYDLAVLKSPVTSDMIELELQDEADYNVGEYVMAIGSPLGEEFINTATVGIVSGKDRFLEVDEANSWGLWLIQTDTAINPGNSGGPLFTMDGKVIGINSLKFVEDGVESMGFAIPTHKVIPMLDSFEQGKSIRPTLGFSAWETANGIEVVEVVEESSAANAGLKPGDIVIGIDGESVSGVNELKIKLNDYVVGQTLDLVVIRSLEEIVLEVELIE